MYTPIRTQNRVPGLTVRFRTRVYEIVAPFLKLYQEYPPQHFQTDLCTTRFQCKPATLCRVYSLTCKRPNTSLLQLMRMRMKIFLQEGLGSTRIATLRPKLSTSNVLEGFPCFGWASKKCTDKEKIERKSYYGFEEKNVKEHNFWHTKWNLALQKQI